MQLTPNFSLAEMTFSETASRHGWDNTPGPREVQNLSRLANMLEQVRALVGKPIFVSSGYRSKRLNDALGSKDTSQHRVGCAADIKVAGMNPDQVVRAIIKAGLPYDQVIREFSTPTGGGWTHISVPNTDDTAPRQQALVIDRDGTRRFA